MGFSNPKVAVAYTMYEHRYYLMGWQDFNSPSIKRYHSLEINTNMDLKKYNSCFIICPLGAAQSESRDFSNAIIEDIIEPVIQPLFNEVVACHRIVELGDINDQVITRLLDCDLLICITGNPINPNVMYELAIRHAARKPVIILYDADARLPFDIQGERAVEINDTIRGAIEARNDLAKLIEPAMSDTEPSNPIYRAISYELIKKVPLPEKDQVILKSLEDVNYMMRLINNKLIHNTYPDPFRIRAGVYKDTPSYTIQLKGTATKETLEKLEEFLSLISRDVGLMYRVEQVENTFMFNIYNLKYDASGYNLLSEYITGITKSAYNIETVITHY